MSSEKIVFLDTEVFKGPRFITDKILDDQTHFKPTKTFQYTHFSSCHPLSIKKGFVKGEALSLVRTNSVKKSFEFKKLQFLTRLLERGYPESFAEDIQSLSLLPSVDTIKTCLLYTSPSPRDQRGSRMPSSA